MPDDLQFALRDAQQALQDGERVRRRGRQPKMKCPNGKCSSHDSHVVRCRISLDGSVMRRRRQCDTCGYRFNTTERIEKSA